MDAGRTYLLAVFCTLLLAACEEEQQQLPKDFMSLREEEPVSESFQMRYKYTINGKLKADVFAPHVIDQPQPREKAENPPENPAAADEAQVKGGTGATEPNQNREEEVRPLDTYTICDSGVKITFFDEFGKVESKLRANYAELYEDQGYAEATGDVVVENNEGDRLNTEKLYWDQERDELWTDRFVRITTPEEIIMGDSMVSNTSFTNYRIYKIRGTITLEE